MGWIERFDGDRGGKTSESESEDEEPEDDEEEEREDEREELWLLVLRGGLEVPSVCEVESEPSGDA